MAQLNASSEPDPMIAIHPYKREDNNSHFKIEDVTNDPKYKDYDPDNVGLEKSFVEYCRLDSPSGPNVYDASTVVSARSVHHEMKAPTGNWKSRIERTTNQPTQKMANIIDVDVGSRCLACGLACRGFEAHRFRKVCVHCKCDRTEHEVASDKVLNVYERLGIKPKDDKTMAAVAQGANRTDVAGNVSNGYSWVPPGLTRAKVEEYMSKLPNHVVPRINSVGEKYREKQLMVQLPRQDLSMAYCKHLKSAVERRIYEEFVNSRNEMALDIGYVCPNLPAATNCAKCNGEMPKNTMAVKADKLGENVYFHPICFVCKSCNELLADLVYCSRESENDIYCERHFAELHKPRCSACDELVFSSEYTKAMNKDWHSEHFVCWNCDGSLTGQRYILRDDRPFCIKCYEEVFANTCDECGKPIGIDSKDLSYKQLHWHSDCFLCSMCRFSLVDQPFGSRNDKIFCSNCYDQCFATRCDGCNEIFRAGMKKMEYKGKQWHDKCFCCAMCKAPIGTKSFIPKNDEVFCSNCYEEKYATRCCKCKKVINSGGVTYKNEPWHRECFVCTNCNSSLAGQRFTSKDDKPFCASCFGELFAKRCSACVKPITGIGGAKFISFEDRHWHNDCFICVQCTASLVGKGFITDGADILCPECAKARLMAQNA
ncbi:Lim-9 [Aphelenchoides besseyi]|nr:Lim-9 [Aphelenchoides besseyi]